MVIFVVGCGATGSYYISTLAQLAIGNKCIEEIVLIDRDLVEVKNLKNQRFTKKDVGKSKAEVLAKRYSKLGIKISYVNDFILSKDDIDRIYQSLDKINSHLLIVSCVDNLQARYHINDYFNSKNDFEKLYYIDTGNDNNTKKGQTVLGYKEKEEVILKPVGDYFNLTEEEDKTEVSCSDIVVENPQHFTTNVISATTTFLITSSILENNIEQLKNVFMFDGDKVSIKPF